MIPPRFKVPPKGFPLLRAGILAAFVALLSAPVAARAAEWIHHGPDGAKITAIAVSPSHTSVVYMATWGAGVFKSTDRGGTWNQVNSGLYPSVFSLAVDPSQEDVVYAGSGIGVYKTVDGGATWNFASTGLDSTTLAFAFDPTHPCTLYAGTPTGVFATPDCGAHWGAAGLAGSYVLTVAVDPIDTRTVYAGTYSSGLFVSGDGGTTWASLSSGLTDLFVHQIAIDPSNPSTIYVATSSDIGGVFKSLDRGMTWSQVSRGYFGGYLVELGLDPSNPSTVYAGSNVEGMFKSTDGGTTWAAVNTGLGYVHLFFVLGFGGLAFDPSSPGTIYAGSFGGGVFKTTDGAANWTWSSAGTRSSDGRSVAVHPGAPSTLYAAASISGFFRSDDGGETWTKRMNGLVDKFIDSVVVDPLDPATVYVAGAEAGIFKSTNSGDDWTSMSLGIPTDGALALAADPSQPGTLYVITNSSGVYKTTTGGATWFPAGNGLPPSPVPEVIAVDPRSPSVVYYGALDTGLYRSGDGGDSWSPIFGLPYPFVQAIAIDPLNSTLYVALDQFPSLWRSDDGGVTWTDSNDGLPPSVVTAVAVDPLDSRIVYAGTNLDGVFVSADGGAHWGPFHSGIEKRWVLHISVNRATRTLYAGVVDGGVYTVDAPILTTLTGAFAPAAAGDSVTFTAAVLGGPGTPSGSVAFTDGGTPIGSAVVDGSGIATLQAFALPQGDHRIQATYTGDPSRDSLPSLVRVQSIVPMATTTTLTSSSNSAAAGSPVTFTATVTPASPAAGIPAGDVALSIDGVAFFVARVDAAGRAIFTFRDIAAGTHSVSATFDNPTGYHARSVSAPLVETIVAGATVAPSSAFIENHRDGMLEPGDTIDVYSAWRNLSTAPLHLTTVVTRFGGPQGADYTILNGLSDFGTLDGGTATPCFANGGPCTRLALSAPAVRPALHWDASFDEAPSTGDPSHTWVVHVGKSFTDVPWELSIYHAVETVLHNGITTGCGAGSFCPGDALTRAQAAVFLLRASDGPAYVPPAATGVFSDVPTSSSFAPWVEELERRGVTAGCGNGRFCPATPLRRREGAVFLVRALMGPSFHPPPATGRFSDVPPADPFSPWIDYLASAGITGGCGSSRFCPDAFVTRGQMAVFLTTAFRLSLDAQ